ncbi:MAG: DUF2937 family protein [Alphaproteobacteria bacterium]|nr:DUF2937 family protein [Alphaproteobacteria bacterium]
MFLMRWMGIAFAVLSGALASQLPEFAQQYRQRLGGALDEINRFLADFDADARAHAMNRAQAVARLKADSDGFLKTRGGRVASYELRQLRLQRQQDDFRQAGPFARLVVFARDFDSELARNAWGDFEPAAPLTAEGAAAAGAGALAGFALWKFLGWPFASRRRRQAATAPAKARV